MAVYKLNKGKCVEICKKTNQRCKFDAVIDNLCLTHYRISIDINKKKINDEIKQIDNLIVRG